MTATFQTPFNGGSGPGAKQALARARVLRERERSLPSYQRQRMRSLLCSCVDLPRKSPKGPPFLKSGALLLASRLTLLRQSSSGQEEAEPNSALTVPDWPHLILRNRSPKIHVLFRTLKLQNSSVSLILRKMLGSRRWRWIRG